MENELRSTVRALLGEHLGAEHGQPDAELVGKLAGQLGALGYLDAGAPVAAGGLGLAGDCVVLTETARHWGSLAMALAPRLLAAHAYGRDAVAGTEALDWGLTLPAGPALVLNGATARRVVLPAGPPGVLRDGAEPLEFDGFRELSVVTGNVTQAHGPAAEPGTGALLRVLLTAVAAGTARGALAAAASYAGQRVQFGQPIGAFGELRAILARASTRVIVTESSLRAIASEPGPPRPAVAAQLLASAVDSAVAVADRCQHVFGGYGHMAEFPAGRFARDARTLAAWADPPPALDDLVAVELGLPDPTETSRRSS